MKKLFTILLLFISVLVYSQNSGINFQGVGRNSSGSVLASTKISLRFSVIQSSETGTVEYIESKEVTTNAQGVFSVVIGDGTQTSKTGNFADINWKINPKFLKVEMDVAGGSNFVAMGTTRLQSVPFAYYANGVNADNVDGVLSMSKGGTGVASISALKTALAIDQINNTSDLAKPISTATQTALDMKVSTSTFSTTVAAKANVADVALKANATDLALKAPIDSPTFTGTVSGIRKTMIGLSNVDNTTDLTKPISAATQVALDSKVETSTFSNTVALKENISNKSTANDLGGSNPSDLFYPSQKAVKEYIASNLSAGGIADGGVTTIKIANGAITNEKIANSAVSALAGINTGDETASSIKSKLGINSIFSGDYSDLINKPSIPDIGNFSFINSTIRTNTSDDMYITSAENANGIYLFPYGTNGFGDNAGVLAIENSGVRIWSKYADNNGVKWDFDQNGNLTLPENGSIILNDGNNTTSLSNILPLPTYHSGYVLTEDGNGNAFWQDKSFFNYLNVDSYGNEPGIFLRQNDPSAPTWLRVGNEGGGAEYGVVGDDNQFFDGTVQGDIALKAFSSSNDKKMFIGATFGGQANLVLSPDGNIKATGKIDVPTLTIGDDLTLPSAALSINSTTQGFLPPRMLEIEKNNIDSPETGLIIFCTDCGSSGLGELQVFQDNSWSGLNGSTSQNTTYTAGNGLTLTGTTFSVGSGAISSTAIADGTITNVDISSAAAITYSKLNLAGSIIASDISPSASIQYSKLNLTNSIVSSDLTTAAISTSILADASITNSKIAGPISVANGGTGTGTLTLNSVVIGNGTNSVQFVAPGASGNILKSNGTTWISDVAPASGATSLDNLSDVRSKGLGFMDGLLIGHKDLPNLYNGVGTTAIGIGVLQNLNNGSYNTAIGNNSMKLIHQGFENVALGAFSLYSVYSGNNNTGIGTSALYSNTKDLNVAVGHSTMYSNTLGSSNSAIGAWALYSNTTGIRNTANGMSSLYASNGDYNTASGFNSLYQNTSGYNNSAFGSDALGGNSSGFNNTAIGYSSGSNIYTGSNNTTIGYYAAASSSSVSNQVTLGNFAVTTLRAAVTSITALSDRRDKTDIIDISEGLNFIKQLKPVSFTWNTRDKSKVGIKAAGFIAQDLLSLQKSSSIGDNLDLVSEDNPEKLEARYNNLLPVMVKAIQDQQAIIDELKKELEAIKKLIQKP